MKCGFLGGDIVGRPRLGSVGFDDENYERDDASDGRQCELPTEEPRFAHNTGLGLRRVVYRRHRERHNAAAIGTDREMSECLLVLVHGQSVLSEGAQLIRIGMLSGLEKVAHVRSDALVGLDSGLSENEEI